MEENGAALCVHATKINSVCVCVFVAYRTRGSVYVQIAFVRISDKEWYKRRRRERQRERERQTKIEKVAKVESLSQQQRLGSSFVL